MPKHLTPEQFEALQAKGAIPPIDEKPPMEPGAVFRALGNTGLPHDEMTERMDVPDATSEEAVTSEGFNEQCQKAYDSATKIMQLVPMAVPDPNSYVFQANHAEISRTFALYEFFGLEPDVVITPTQRTLSFWENIARKLQDSSHNSHKVLRDGGLYIADNVKTAWTSLVDRPGEAPGWDLSVVSGKNKPEILNVTTFGYTDEKNQSPSVELNDLLHKLSLPKVPGRGFLAIPGNSASPLIQPDIHPYVDAYLMYQLTRIVQRKDPVDNNTWSWIKGALADGDVPAGCWGPDRGQVFLGYSNADGSIGDIGVRPSSRG